MRRIGLRAVRKILRRLDAALDVRGDVSSYQNLLKTNGREGAIDAFLSAVDTSENSMDEYVREHRQRLIRTLSLLPLGDPGMHALELGSYLHMAAAMERVLDYGWVRPAYYGDSVGHDTKRLLIRGQPPYSAEIDLFDAERHTYPYSDGFFDVILCCELIEHLLSDPLHMLLECRRVLKDHGLFVLTTPSSASLTSVAAALGGKHTPQVFSKYPAKGNPDVPHVREYTPYEIDQALRAACFGIESLTTERAQGATHATWVLEILRDNGFETCLRGEQIYCLARKERNCVPDRFPQFLYAT